MLNIPEEGYYQPEVFPWNGGHDLTEELAFMKRKVIPFLLNHPYSGPFRYPVNAKAEGIFPDYFKVCNLASSHDKYQSDQNKAFSSMSSISQWLSNMSESF